MTYRAPVADIQSALDHGADFASALREGLFGDLTEDVVEAVLAEAGRFAGEVIAPLNAVGDRARHASSRTAPSPCRRAGRRPTGRGRRPAGTALPRLRNAAARTCRYAVNAACIEMWNSAAMAFGLGPLLTMAGVDALAAHGSDELKRALSRQARLRRVDGDDAAHRAAGRLRRRRAAHARGARRRRQLPHHRPEDLHHLRRARPDRQHHPFRAGAAAGRAARHARAFRCSWCRNSCSTPDGSPGRAQRRARAFDRAQARHPCLADLHHGVRRPRRRAPAISSARRTTAWPACSR